MTKKGLFEEQEFGKHEHTIRFEELMQEMQTTWRNKNAGYAGLNNPDPYANFRLSEWFGVKPSLGAMIRMGDKFRRLTNLAKNSESEKVGESMKDTLMDLAVYCLITICLLDEENQKRG